MRNPTRKTFASILSYLWETGCVNSSVIIGDVCIHGWHLWEGWCGGMVISNHYLLVSIKYWRFPWIIMYFMFAVSQSIVLSPQGSPWLFIGCLIKVRVGNTNQISPEQITYYFIGLKKVQEFLFKQNLLSSSKGLLSRKKNQRF